MHSRSWFTVVFVASALTSLACGPGKRGAHFKSATGAQSVDYSIPALDGESIDSATFRGRTTVLLFITTFDVFSQAQAERLEDLYRSRQPRINAAAIVMEPPQNIELVRAFVQMLKITYPVGMADQRELGSQGFLGTVQSVPAWIFLDARGQLVATGLGSLSLTELKQALAEAENSQ